MSLVLNNWTWVGSYLSMNHPLLLQYEQYKDFGAEDYLLNTGGIICPNRGCGEGMVLDQNPGRNVQCASCQVYG